MKKNQYGFAALEAVLIIIVIAVIAGLGWYVYRANQKDAKPATGSQSSSDTKNPDGSQSNDVVASYVTISEWGIRAPYDGKQKLTYKIDSNTNIAYFGSQELAALDPECSQNGGWIYRYAPTDRTNADLSGPAAKDAAKADNSYVKAGDYYYHFGHSQAGCGDIAKTQTLQMQLNDIVEALVPKLTTIPR